MVDKFGIKILILVPAKVVGFGMVHLAFNAQTDRYGTLKQILADVKVDGFGMDHLVFNA